MLRIAIQKSGRLAEKSLGILSECGIRIPNGSGTLKASASNFPLEVLFLRDDDIPQYVADGVADVGILGENVVREKGKNLRIVEPLGFAKCRLSLAIQREKNYEGLEWFQGKRIATSYPNILQQFLDENKIQATLEAISGSVEIAPGIGLADAICDLVSTGSTLYSNGLKEVQTILESQAVIVAKTELEPEKETILDQLLFRIRAYIAAREHKYILLNAPNDAIPAITALLPGMKSPTVLPLSEPGWSSLHSVVREDTFWSMIDELKRLGAEGILVTKIEKMIQ